MTLHMDTTLNWQRSQFRARLHCLQKNQRKIFKLTIMQICKENEHENGETVPENHQECRHSLHAVVIFVCFNSIACIPKLKGMIASPHAWNSSLAVAVLLSYQDASTGYFLQTTSKKKQNHIALFRYTTKNQNIIEWRETIVS